MTVLARFNPAYGSGKTVSPGAASASTSIGAGQKTVCVTNLNAVLCYVRIGPSGITASTADHPVPPNAQVFLTKNQDADTIAYIAPAGGGSLHIMPGEGF